MSRNILFIDQSGQLGGAELCLADLAAGLGGNALLFSDGPFAGLLRKRGVPVAVVSAGEAILGAGKGGSHLRSVGLFFAMTGFVSRLRAATRAADLLYFNTAKALVFGKLARPGRRTPSVFHLHDLLDPAHFSTANIRILVAAANRTSALIANSMATADAFRRAGGKSPLTVIPNGFDPSDFDAVDPSDVKALRAQWNPGGRPVVSVFGRLSRWKGQDVLLRAAAALPDVVVWIVGDALFTEDDRAYASELRGLARDPALAGRVVFAGHQSAIPLWMRASDLVVHTSVAAEPFGRVVVEAMLAGRPVVASRAGGPAEILIHGETGLLVPPGDSLALLEILRELIAAPELQHQLAKRAGQVAREKYTLPSVLEQTRQVLEPLLHR